MKKLNIKNINFGYSDNHLQEMLLIENFSLVIDKKVTCLLGPNGCGKSTVLKIIAGIILPSNGEVKFVDGNNFLDNKELNIGYVVQNYRDSLLPWFKVYDNIALNLKAQGVSKEERINAVRSFLAELDVNLPLESYPYELSGGQQQMVSIVRSLMRSPDILLMDEPFSALDFKSKLYMQDKLLDILSRSDTITIFVTHDINEAVYLADRLILLSDSKPVQVLADLKSSLGVSRDPKIRKSKHFFDMVNIINDFY